jgi:hypothetical protein
MQTAMRGISIVLATLLGWQPCWSAGQQTDGGTPARTNVPGTNVPGKPQRGNGATVPAKAPDGDSYTPPKSTAKVPKGHPMETYPGRRPAGPRGSLIGVGGGLVGLGAFLEGRNQPGPKLARDGPKMPESYSMSSFRIAAFVRGNWPVVIDHVLSSGGQLSIDVTVEGFPTFRYPIPATGRRRQVIFRLPAYFPARPTPGTFTIQASGTSQGGARPYLRLFGMGAGERAVGSVAIDQVKFGPDTIHPKQKQEATYAFHAHTDFDRVRAEFMKAAMEQGQIVAKLEDHADINGVERETTSSRAWNGKKATPGEHLLQVRAWESVLAKSNWVIAWSPDQVSVEE